MMHKTGIVMAAALLLACAAGCGTKDNVYVSRAETQQNAADETEVPGSGTQSGAGDESGGTQKSGAADESGASGSGTQKSGADGGAADESGAAGSGTQMSAGTENAAGMQASEAGDAAGQCYVYVCGEVKAPGVYLLPPGARIFEAVAQAGGMTENAGATAVNLAGGISDGQMVYIPTKEEAETLPAAGQGTDSAGEAVSDSPEAADDRVNLNTASETELMTLSGIGQAKAEAILAYRETHGGFSSVEEIMNVDGIKEGLYNRIKDDIKVK